MTPLPDRLPSRPRALVRLLVALVGAAIAFSTAAPAAATTRGDGLRAGANAHRLDGGLEAVVGTSLLDDIANHRANQMASADLLAHDMTYVRERLDAAGVCQEGFGEIIASQSGYPDYSYDRVIDLWWNSPGHRAIMMTPDYNAAGGSWRTAADGTDYSVMVFVDLCDGAAPTSVSYLRLKTRYDPDRPMVLRRGSQTGYRLSSEGDVLGSRTIDLASRATGTAAGRTRVNGRAYLKVSGGPLAGYWVRESRRSFVRGMTQRWTYEPTRRIRFDAGSYRGLLFDRKGRVTSKRTMTRETDKTFRARARAIINGQPYFKICSGTLDGYWVRDTDHLNPA